VQERRLGAGHVGGEAGEKNHHRAVAVLPLVGELYAVRAGEEECGQGKPPIGL
jgi:hypothetical protein